MVSRITSPTALRKLRWLALAFWLIVIVGSGAAGLPAEFEEVQENERSSFLPAEAESTRVLDITEELQGSDLAPIVVAYRRDGGLTAADQKRIAADRKELNAGRLPQTTRYEESAPSPDGTGALMIASIKADGENHTILDPVERAREVSAPDGGLETGVAGGAALSADAIAVFESINGTLLLATGTIVFLLLLAVYRSPIFWILPLAGVIFAEVTARSIGVGLSELGVTINGQSAGILSVLVFGAGTDYALLLVARYREELQRHDNRYEAMSIALRRAGPAILASGGTVIAALLCLTLAEVEGSAGLGPIGAVGIAVAMASMLTALPALLLVTGRRMFWPFVPEVGESEPDVTRGLWKRVGVWIAPRPRKVWVGALAVLVVMSLGLLNLDTSLTQADIFRDDVDSIASQELIEESFPGGASAPVEIVVTDPGDVEEVVDAIQSTDGIAGVDRGPMGEVGALLLATTVPDPFSEPAFDLVKGLRETVDKTADGEVLVGGASAVESDLRDSAERDSLVIPPITLAVVLLILIVLLRAVVAPLLLMATVVISFAAALGVGYIVFDVVFGFPGGDAQIPLLAFIFLVALGVDYNIFLMARAREETERYGSGPGMLRALAVTGGVITSAGLVLAGTFSALGVLPLTFLTELGFVVAFGVLLDTFLVRSILVPAAVLDIGQRTWWPSKLARRDETALEGKPSANG